MHQRALRNQRPRSVHHRVWLRTCSANLRLKYAPVGSLLVVLARTSVGLVLLRSTGRAVLRLVVQRRELRFHERCSHVRLARTHLHEKTVSDVLRSNVCQLVS